MLQLYVRAMSVLRYKGLLRLRAVVAVVQHYVLRSSGSRRSVVSNTQVDPAQRHQQPDQHHDREHKFAAIAAPSAAPAPEKVGA